VSEREHLLPAVVLEVQTAYDDPPGDDEDDEPGLRATVDHRPDAAHDLKVVSITIPVGFSREEAARLLHDAAAIVEEGLHPAIKRLLQD